MKIEYSSRAAALARRGSATDVLLTDLRGVRSDPISGDELADSAIRKRTWGVFVGSGRASAAMARSRSSHCFGWPQRRAASKAPASAHAASSRGVRAGTRPDKGPRFSALKDSRSAFAHWPSIWSYRHLCLRHWDLLRWKETNRLLGLAYTMCMSLLRAWAWADAFGRFHGRRLISLRTNRRASDRSPICKRASADRTNNWKEWISFSLNVFNY